MASEVIAPVSDMVAPVTAVQSPSADGVLQPMSQILAATRLPTPILKTSTCCGAVRPELLDRLVNQTGEVMISRSRMEAEIAQLRGSLTDLATNLERLRYQLRDVELQAESQMQTRMAQARTQSTPLIRWSLIRFTRVQELTRMMAESVSDVATVQRNLQRAVDATEDGLAAQARQTRELQRFAAYPDGGVRWYFRPPVPRGCVWPPKKPANRCGSTSSAAASKWTGLC